MEVNMLSKIREDATTVSKTIGYKLANKLANKLATLEDEEEACKDPGYAYLFAKYIPGANIEKCQEAACKDSCWAYMFALTIPVADKEKCRKACEGSKYAF